MLRNHYYLTTIVCPFGTFGENPKIQLQQQLQASLLLFLPDGNKVVHLHFSGSRLSTP